MKEEITLLKSEILADERPVIDETVITPEELKKFDSLPIQIEVVFARKTLTLGQLAALKKGALLPFDDKEIEGVEIFANGVLVGKGEMVAIGDTFGAKIIHFL